MLVTGSLHPVGAEQTPAATPLSATEVTGTLQGKLLYLRGRWSGDKLKFDSTGVPLNKLPQTSFTLSGVRIEKVKPNGTPLN